MKQREFLENIDSYIGKTAKVKCTDNAFITGVIVNYASQFDNEPNPASIIIQEDEFLTEVYISEILSCEIL